MRKPFLTARWTHLLNLTYGVDPALLRPLTPKGIELDVQDGQAFVSLVAFEFLNTRVLGIPWPGYQNFPELNLRFYIKTPEGKRGVVFIKEYVPKRIIATMARRIYNEPYVKAPMRSSISENDTLLTYHQELDVGGQTHTIDVTAMEPAFMSPDDDPIHYFKEHDVGFGVNHKGKTLLYEVHHPTWRTYRVQSHKLDLDFGKLYGDTWAFLNNETPHKIIFAEGSEIKVFPPGLLS